MHATNCMDGAFWLLQLMLHSSQADNIESQLLHSAAGLLLPDLPHGLLQKSIQHGTRSPGGDVPTAAVA
jgi:hypothetical protein